jgi:hypothetical protein
MRRSLGTAAAALAAAGCLAAAPSGALADAGAPALVCNGTYAGGTYGNVVVPPNGICSLSDATVLGNIAVLDSGTLNLNPGTTPNSTVYGDISGAPGSNIDTGTGWTVDGTIATEQANILGVTGGTTHSIRADGTQDVFISGTTIDGDVAASGTQSYGVIGQNPVLTGNVAITGTAAGAAFNLDNQLVDGSVYVLANQTQVEVYFNTIRHNLVCLGNNPPPDDLGGDGNYVQGREIGQCAAFPSDPGDGVEGG